MINFNTYGKNIYSQNGENGIIDECLKRIGIRYGVAVEFGAPNRYYCSNIAHLKDFALIYFDDNPEDDKVHKAFITAGNVNEIIPDCNVLSIDIDGNDYEVWKAFERKPEIVVIEINSSLDPDVFYFSPERGSSFCTMNSLAEAKGYFLVCHTGNCVYVLNKYKEFFKDVKTEFNRSWLPVQQ